MSNNYTPSEPEEASDNFYTNLPSLNINSIQSSHQTSPISPDEIVIRSRGRRKLPCSFSPDTLTTTSPKNSVTFTRHFPSPNRSSSPPKIAKPGRKTCSVSRLSASTERVRRHLDFAPDDHQDFSILKLLPVIQKGDTGHAQRHASETEFLASHKVKKQKINPISGNQTSTNPSPLQLAKGLSKSQLVDLLASLTAANPHLSDTLAGLLPKPDLSGLISNLTYLNQNIYKAIPVTRLSDRTDSQSCCHPPGGFQEKPSGGPQHVAGGWAVG
jgi:hypothetical protein